MRELPFAAADICLQTAALTAGEEAERSVGSEDFACPQHRRRELRVRGAAGEVLGLKGKAAVLFQRDAALAGGGAVLQEVAGVEPGWVVYIFMLMPVLSLDAQAQRLWLAPRGRSRT